MLLKLNIRQAIVFKSCLLAAFFLCSLTANPVFGQKIPSFLKKASAGKLFDAKQYDAAAQAFEQELTDGKGDPSATRAKIGVCYLKINHPQKALPWLQQVTAEGKADGETWYNYGLALQQVGNYREAIGAFEQCLQQQAGHPMAATKIESCQFAMTHSRVNPYINFRLATEVNTPGGEFSTSLYANNVVYYSSAGITSDKSKTDQRTGLQYVETYMAHLQNKKLIYPQPADNTLPKYVSEGLFAYDSISHFVYFAYCDLDNNRCGIYSSHQANGKWVEPELVLQNKKDQVSGHPALANGGNRLYFTSNSTEGVGQTDIWYIDRINGKWGQPINAGNVINTFGREEFPFVYADSLLFFASDGHVGYGGLDIFCSVIRGNSLMPPVNIRRPYNSQGDDFSLVISGHTGILSSSRNETMSDDIYMFEGLPSYLYLSGKTTDAITSNIIKNTRLTLSVDGKAVQQTVSDSTGHYAFFLKEEEHPMMYVRAVGYKPSLTDVQVAGVRQFTDLQRDIRLQQSIVLPATIRLYNKTTGNPIAERGIICFNNDGETQILRTDASGSFKLTMQEDQREYWVKFPDGDYLAESVILNEEQKTYSLGVQPLKEELFTGWLHFKRGSTEVTEMSQALIPRIAAVIKANPGILFQIAGFCDTGFEARIPNLASQRAEYILRRLVDEGVDKKQLNSIAGRVATGKAAAEEENASQRRVEIKAKK